MYTCGNDDLQDTGSIGEGHFGVVSKMYHASAQHIMAVKVTCFVSLSHTHTLSLSQKIPMKDLRTSGGNVLELDVIKKAKECPFIVHFYGCLLREVISQAFDPAHLIMK